MNESGFSLRAARTSAPFLGYLGAFVVAAMLVLSGCKGGSDDAKATDVFEPSGVPVLDAVAYSRPSAALDDPADPTLVDYGDLLFNELDLNRGYVLDDQWCDSESAQCVTVSGDETVQFAGEPLKSFVLDPDYRVDSPDIEVVDMRAIHHPVSDQLRLVFDVKPTEVAWGTNYNGVEVTSENGAAEARLDGPDNALPGVVSHYELGPLDEPVSGPVKFLVTFSDGIQDGATVQLAIKLNDSVPDIERSEAPLDQRKPVAIYRPADELPEADGDGDDGDEAIEALIAALVDGTDTSTAVAQDSPGAMAVAALADAGRLVTLRRDPTNPMALCWQTSVRGTFCERWHAGVTKGGALTSWSVEGTSIDNLVVNRAGSFPGTSTTLIRAMTTDVVLARTEVTNNTSSDLYLTMYEPQVQRDGQVRDALAGDGGYEILEGKTEIGSALIESSDVAFDLLYAQSIGVNEDNLRFDSESGPAKAGESGATSDLDDVDTASVRLASLLHKQRFDDAVGEASPGSPAEAYLRSFASVASETRLWVDDGDEPVGSTRVCLNTSGVVCTTVEVTAVDDEGRPSALSIEGVDTNDLVEKATSVQSGDFTATIENTILWPKWGAFLTWTIENDSDGDVRIDSINLVSPDGVIIEPRRPVFEEVPANRTVSGASEFETDALEGTIEITGSGRGAVRSLKLVMPLDPSAEKTESTVELEATETEFETPAGTTLEVPGDWSEIYWQDDDTGKIAGDDTTLNRVKSIYLGDLKLLAFAPDFSPADLSTDELIEQLGQLGEITDATEREISLGDGTTRRVIGAAAVDIFHEPNVLLIIPGKSDLIVMATTEASPEASSDFVEPMQAIMRQIDAAE